MAALRYWRHYVDTGVAPDDPGPEDVPVASVDEIDDLCEEINTGGQRLAP